MIGARLGLGGLVLALAATAALLALAPMPAPPLPPVAARPTPTAPPPPASSAAATARILARPLFRPDRRPVAAASADAALMPRLSGILRGDAVRLAIFARPSGKPVLLGEGAQLGGYRIVRIGRRAVLLDGPRGRLRLVPRFAHAAGAAPQATLPKPAAEAGILIHPGPR